ncbi:MAG TPA: SRPBCC family protein [Thermoplasmata archaeon]|nr:SRPBCC family protein [Thermoplasmata archaeon]
MVDYQHEQLFPFPMERVWKLLQDHRDDTLISRVHPLVKQQRTVARDGDSVIVDRTIDARGKLLASQWKLTAHPPETFRWEIVSSNGPYAAGSWMENTYSTESGGTRIRSRGELKITVLPFFFPQRPVLRRVLDTIDAEDQAYLRG